MYSTNRLTIRPMQLQDEALFCELFCSNRIMANIDTAFHLERAQKAFKCTLRESEKTTSATLCWVIQLGHSSLGLVSLNNIEPNQGADVGIMMLTSAQGKLIADETIDWLAKHAFGQLRLKYLRAEFSSNNFATKRITKKFGFSSPVNLTGKTSWQECILRKENFKPMF